MRKTKYHLDIEIDGLTNQLELIDMGHIKEPKDIDFVVDPTPLTDKDKKKISEIIAYYKATGRKKKFRKGVKRKTRGRLAA